MMTISRPKSVRRAASLAAILMAGAAWPAFAQPADPVADEPVVLQDAPAAQEDEEDAIVVTGYRASLASAARAKRENIGFTESVFAEDIGKFPDTNIAEAFNRVPGITIARETTGEGLNIAIRGLGTNFTRILLNGAPVAIASTGRTDSQNTNREVDLDLFPTELFTQLTVSKSPTAGMVEGGAAGTVNMRSARPFDNPGTHITYSAQTTKGSNSDKWGYRGSVIASFTSGDFGILAGVAGVRNHVYIKGFESIGWTNANLSATQSSSATRNNTGGGNWTIPGTVPANAGNNLTTGATINEAFLLANNPGLNITQIDNALIPRLGRPSDEYGTKDRVSGVVALEWRPSDALHFYVDGMYGHRWNDLERIDMNWVGRNGAAIPINMKVDRSDCSAGCVVTEGTFANAQFFLEYRPFIEETEFWGVNPGFEFRIADNLKLDVQGNWTESNFHRESPTVLVITPPRSGTTVTYRNDGGVPSITSNVDLNNPASFGWPSNTIAASEGGRTNMQDERRWTVTKGVRGNLEFDVADNFEFRVGAAYDDVSRTIRAYDNPAWQNAVCGNRPSVYLPGNRQPFCNGLNSPGAAAAQDPTYPAYGTGSTAGQTGPVTYGGSLIPQAALASYLMPGPAGYITVDWDRFKAASNYDAFHAATPEATSSNTSANAGYVRERVFGAYIEANGNVDLFGRELRFNAGMRYVHTKQTIGGYVSIPNPNNPASVPAAQFDPFDGSRYPNALQFVYTDSSYEKFLPSANLAYSVVDNGLIRFSMSKTMTRPNPNSMLPGLNFSSPSADTGSRGNPNLGPFLSNNIDLGFEYYFGGGRDGYVAIAGFSKSLTGFTANGNITVPFTDLAQYGVTFDTLSSTQQGAINARGGPSQATVVLTQQVNASGVLDVRGLEATLSLPFDFLLESSGLKGFGIFLNGTLVDQKGSGAAPAIAVGVARYSYNASFYYENHGLSARISTNWAEGSQQSLGNQNGIAAAALFSDNYQQWDFSSSVDLDAVLGIRGAPQLTFDVTNITKAKQRSYFQFPNATFTLYDPGRQFTIGLRGRF